MSKKENRAKMCGIAGIINLDGRAVDNAILLAMSRAMTHRGPDGEGVEIWDSGVGFAHRRLSIIDLAAGAQPMANEDGSIWVTFNGEIYNHQALRQRLEAKGHQFKTHCDTETLVHLYEEDDDDFAEKLEGMFALAIYDANRRRVILARDRLGQKPLYYCHNANAGVFAFASEFYALTRHPDVPREINPQASRDYLSLQYIPAPNTIYKAVSKLEPGHVLTLDIATGQSRASRYWRVNFAEKSDMTYADAKARLRETLTRAVEKRLMSDVPLGAFLSGGIDSTIIVGLMAELSAEPVQTFTIGFGESRYDERCYAEIAAKRHGTRHYVKEVKPDDFAVVQKLVRHYGEPYADSSMLPTYLLSQFTRERVTVALSGDGADELFAGYYRYLAFRYGAMTDWLPLPARRGARALARRVLPPKTEERSIWGKIHRTLDMVAVPPDARYFDIINRFDESMKRSILGEAARGAETRPTLDFMRSIYRASTASNAVETLMDTDIATYLPGDVLTKVDIASMACSLEARSPFMDHEVVELAASLPLSYKQGAGLRKRILIDAFADLIPEPLRHRGKLGFGVPVAAWLRGAWKEPARDLLLNGHAVQAGLLRNAALDDLLNAHINGQADYSYPLWALLILELWLREMKR